MDIFTAENNLVFIVLKFQPERPACQEYYTFGESTWAAWI